MVGLRHERRSNWWVAEVKKKINLESELTAVSKLCTSAPRRLMDRDDRAPTAWGRARAGPADSTSGEIRNQFDVLETEEAADEDEDDVEDEGAFERLSN